MPPVPEKLRVGVVLIGRNEGQRLVRSLDSVCGRGRPVVYVDSGSTDRSVAEANERGAVVVDLDMSRPFSAARARNAGWRRLDELHGGDLDAVLFIDGDCVVVDGFIDDAAGVLTAAPDVVAVCGYRRELHPEASPYNRMCDVEWRYGAPGDVRCFGGDVMIRLDALRTIDGYDPAIIAGEDEEIGIRLRRDTGGRLVRLNRDSTLHDANMHHLSQWWQRAKRCGHAYAHVNQIHGAPPERHYEENLRRTYIWGALAPSAAVLLAPVTLGLSLGLLARYPVAAARVAMRTRAAGFPLGHAAAWGVGVSVAPFPEFFGVVKFHRDRLQGRAPTLIEYK